MDTVTKAVGAFVVFCVGVAIVILAASFAFRPTDKPCYTPPQPTYYTCPYCRRQFERPQYDTTPAPNLPRPGNLGDKDVGSKRATETK